MDANCLCSSARPRGCGPHLSGYLKPRVARDPRQLTAPRRGGLFTGGFSRNVYIFQCKPRPDCVPPLRAVTGLAHASRGSRPKSSHRLRAPGAGHCCQWEHVFCPSSKHKCSAFSTLIRHRSLAAAGTSAVGDAAAILAQFLFPSPRCHG